MSIPDLSKKSPKKKVEENPVVDNKIPEMKPVEEPEVPEVKLADESKEPEVKRVLAKITLHNPFTKVRAVPDNVAEVVVDNWWVCQVKAGLAEWV